MRLRRYKTGLWLGLGLLTFVVVCAFSPARVLFEEGKLTLLFQSLGLAAAPLFVLMFTVATTLGFPGNVMSVAAGAIFGLFWGTVWSVIGSTLGATGAFWVARYSLHDWAEQQFGHLPTLQRLNQAITQQPFNFVMAVRFTPLSPFSLVNFLFGLTPLDLKTYMAGTFVGIIPLSATYAWLGVTGRSALQGGDRLPVLLALSLLALLSLLPMLTRSRR